MAAPRIDTITDLFEIGRGGASVVYRGVEQRTGRQVAVKVLNVDVSDDGGRRRFEREATTLRQLADIEGVVTVFDAVVSDDGRPCIVMEELVESAGERLVREGPWSVTDVIALGAVVATTLQRLHGRGVVHRDIKPANILIGARGEIVVSDFDISSVESGAASTLTLGSLTPPHAAPERLNGVHDVGIAADIWSLGSTLFTLLEGTAPFGTAHDEGGLAGLVERVEVASVPASRRNDVPQELWAVIERALMKDPQHRFGSAALFAEALEAIDLAVEPYGAGRAHAPHGAAPRRSGRWGNVAIVAAAITAVGAAVAVAIW